MPDLTLTATLGGSLTAAVDTPVVTVGATVTLAPTTITATTDIGAPAVTATPVVTVGPTVTLAPTVTLTSDGGTAFVTTSPTVTVAPVITVGAATGSEPVAAAPTTPGPQAAYVNIFRLASSAEIPAADQAKLTLLQQQVDAGAITPAQAVLKVADMAIGATSVAVTSYNFFSGLTPSADGLTYLVHSPSNPTDLSDSYYTQFNTENRYINFASNLGLHSDYAAGFAQVYGAMTFQQAVATAYDRIIGTAEATAAGINAQAAVADIVSRQSYFQAVAHERFGNDNQDLSTKLAAVAYILEESVKADVGRYGHAEQNFLFDLADGKAQFHVDLVGTYGGFAQPTNLTT